MKVDVYTKSVLTVIAVCLVVLTLTQIDIIPEARAEASAAAQSNQVRANYDGSINVRVIELPTGSYGIPVEIKRVSFGATLPVEVKNNRLNVQIDRTVDVNVKNSYIYTKDY